MSVTRLQKWDLTPIEIALDLETARRADSTNFPFSGPAEPRICLVAAFALTSQLKRIVAAVDRAVPHRPPSGLRIAQSAMRATATSERNIISVQPMSRLLRLQSKLIRAVEPGLARGESAVSLAMSSEMSALSAAFIADFIAMKTLPSFEPPSTATNFAPTDVKAVGLTVYRLGHGGTPQSILAHWAYPQDTRHARQHRAVLR
jgi:hypothetical protein